MITTEDVLESIANELRDVRGRLAELKAVETALVSRARDVVGEARGPISAHGKVVLTVSTGKRFNPDRAQLMISAKYGEDVLREVSDLVVNGEKVKAQLGLDAYELCQAPNAFPTITPAKAAA